MSRALAAGAALAQRGPLHHHGRHTTGAVVGDRSRGWRLPPRVTPSRWSTGRDCRPSAAGPPQLDSGPQAHPRAGSGDGSSRWGEPGCGTHWADAGPGLAPGGGRAVSGPRGDGRVGNVGGDRPGVQPTRAQAFGAVEWGPARGELRRLGRPAITVLVPTLWVRRRRAHGARAGHRRTGTWGGPSGSAVRAPRVLGAVGIAVAARLPPRPPDAHPLRCHCPDSPAACGQRPSPSAWRRPRAGHR